VYNRTELDNRLRIVTERIPHVKSVAMGIWVNVGSRDEESGEEGISHLIEHMIFKGTARRNALQIAKEIDQVGGMSNAFTSKEFTCFHAKVMSDHLPMVTDLLTDIFLSSLFNAEDLERERQVILQEIKMVEDTRTKWSMCCSPKIYGRTIRWGGPSWVRGNRSAPLASGIFGIIFFARISLPRS
jgi:predicted Zn-dependent peptidase